MARRFLLRPWVRGLYELSASSYMTDVNVAKDQPVPFSHKHHVGELGLIAATATRRWRIRAFGGNAADANLHDMPFADLGERVQCLSRCARATGKINPFSGFE